MIIHSKYTTTNIEHTGVSQKNYADAQGSSPEISNNESTQDFINFLLYKPEWGVHSKGDWCGSYLCMTERPSNPDAVLSYVKGGVSRKMEMCYWNDLAQRFQDRDNEWVTVTHWAPVPKAPYHQSTLISRTEMNIRVLSGELKIIYHMQETEEHYQESQRIALFSVSYNEPLFYSSTRSAEHIEDYMYAVLAKNR